MQHQLFPSAPVVRQLERHAASAKTVSASLRAHGGRAIKISGAIENQLRNRRCSVDVVKVMDVGEHLRLRA